MPKNRPSNSPSPAALALAVSLLASCTPHPYAHISDNVRTIAPNRDNNSANFGDGYNKCLQADVDEGDTTCEQLVKMDANMTGWLRTAVAFAEAGGCKGARDAARHVLNRTTNADFRKFIEFLMRRKRCPLE